MSKEYERLCACCESIRSRVDFEPKIALVLGSGLGDYGQEIDVRYTVKYSDIKGFPVSTVQGHKGCFLFGYVGDVPIVAMQGRVHYYEGYQMNDVVLPIRVMKMLGARYLILTNAAGGVNTSFNPGDLMMITDQISDFVPSPLIGENIEDFGPRFPDMSQIYDPKLRTLIKGVSEKLAIPIKEGVYLQFTGPNYETPAEIRMSRLLGADAVGMSTACEAIAANHARMQICGVSCITNMAAGILDQPLNHEEVQATADRISSNFKRLITEIISEIGALSL